MKERAEAVGAELHIQAQPGQGTLLRISAPTLFDRSPTSEE
jgi:signal transduction histidine kinase